MPRTTVRSRVASARARNPYAPRHGNRMLTRWVTGEFVALDGEGFSEGEEYHVRVKSSGAVYTGREHYYAYLAASDGSEIYADQQRIGIGAALSFVCEIQARNPCAIVVAFGGSYDVLHMVAHALTRDQILRLIGKHPRYRSLDIDVDGYSYRLEYRPRKSFTVRRWDLGEPKVTYSAKGVRKLSAHLAVTVWDVWGFFQDSFVGVMDKWLPGDADREMIRRMKGERAVFERSEIEQIRVYNAAELRCLVKIMEKVRDAVSDLGFKLKRWDGAGAVAAAMMAAHRVKDHSSELPPEVFAAARCAYSGGHIETCKLGYYSGKVHHYDLNSAYPSVFRELPSLRVGQWRKNSGGEIRGFAIVHCSFEFPDLRPFYPLFFRSADGTIIYPQRGRGWYWQPEYQVAIMFRARFGGTITVHEAWQFETERDERPFRWVEDAYQQRQAYVAASKLGGYGSGPEKIIKLGLNSLYGKTAQQVGARIDADGNLKLPAYFQLAWAGYVTAGCRARLMEAALQKPDAIIGFATDGLFSTEALELDCPDEKRLGAWEYQQHDGITMVMPGVYWLHDGEKVKNYSRGFDKAQMSDPEFIHDAWRRKQETIAISITRLVGFGSACASNDFFRMRGDFVTSRRTLALDGDNSKRYPVRLADCRPDRGLVDTWPRDHFGANDEDDIPLSAPYPISWLDGDLFDRLDAEGEFIERDEMETAALV